MQFVQTGVPLEIQSSHTTLIKITGQTATATKMLKLEGGVAQKICLTDPNSPPESYKITPEGCHEFKNKVYSFTPGKKLELEAKKHQHSWNIIAPSKIQDLKVTKNGLSFLMEEAQKNLEAGIKILEKVTSGGVTYEIQSMEEPSQTVKWQVFSYGFIFEPSAFSIDTLNECRENLLKVVAKQSHVIKGKLMPPLGKSCI